MTYIAKTFNLPKLTGISEKQVGVHLALYEGYVKHVNLILSTIAGFRGTEHEGEKYAVAELRRRLGFEFDGMRMHEHYFLQFEGGSIQNSAESSFTKAVQEKYGGTDEFIAHLKDVASSRGIGWVVVYADTENSTLHTIFVNDHELGQLAGLPIILAIDLWEHAYMVDYVPAEKKSYIDAFLANVNWSVVEKRFDTVYAR